MPDFPAENTDFPAQTATQTDAQFPPAKMSTSPAPPLNPKISPANVSRQVATDYVARKKAAKAARRPAKAPRFKLWASMGDIAIAVPMPAETAAAMGYPEGSCQWLPVQSRLEDFIVSKYLAYGRRFKLIDIFENIHSQLKGFALISKAVHPDYEKVIYAIYQDLFPHLIEFPIPPGQPIPRGKQKPKKKFCSGCNKLLSTSVFRSVRQNADGFFRICIRCEQKSADKVMADYSDIELQPQTPQILQLPPVQLPQKSLDNPTHDPDILDGDI
jgi:hypothetical protein